MQIPKVQKYSQAVCLFYANGIDPCLPCSHVQLAGVRQDGHETLLQEPVGQGRGMTVTAEKNRSHFNDYNK